MSLLNIFRRQSPPATPISISEEKILASLLVMAWVVEARDPYTGGHLWRVSRFASLLGKQAGLSENERARITIGGFLHDLGKVGIPDAILNKKDKLTDEEYAVIKTHPEIGRRMLSGHPFSGLAMDAVFMHHETPDGKGYPRGLKQNEIPAVASIVGICDAFDAMTSSRPYRKGMPVEKALSIIKENLGRQFDGHFGEHFLKLGQSDNLLHVIGHSDEGIPMQTCLMCGPTIVIPRGTRAGDTTYCRCCTGEYKVEEDAGEFHVTPTGSTGKPADMETQPDDGLITQIVTDTVRNLHLTMVS